MASREPEHAPCRTALLRADALATNVAMSHTAETIRPAAASAAASRGRSVRFIALVAATLSALAFGWTLRGYFLGDDFGYVGRFYEYPLAQWPRLFVESWAGNMWGFQLRELRPVTALSFMIDGRLWTGHAFGFRLTNLLLHATCSTLVGVLAWRAAGRDLICGLAAAALFAVHPAHAEPVQWITGRVDVLTTTLYLAGFLAFLRYRDTGGRGALIGIVAFYFTAAFAKEFGLTLPLMMLAADALWWQTWRRWRDRTSWLPYLLCVAVVVIYYLCRRTAFGPGGTGAAVPDPGNLDFQKLFSQRQLVYFGHLLPPLERWWHDGAMVLNEPARRVFALATLAAFAVLAGWRWLARHRPVEERRAFLFFGLGWYAIATVPLVVTYISPRHLYLASAGVCIALAVFLRGLLRVRAVVAVVIVGVAALFAQRLLLTMKPWHDAAVISGEIARELRALEPVAKPGGALLLDVPEIREGAYVWTWAVPFALRPPFTRTPLAERMVVFESRGLYVDWERWHEQPAVTALRHVEVESWILQFLPDKPSHRIAVPAETVRRAAEHFSPERAKSQPHEMWRALINEMTPQP